jgi:glucose uptake protein GlcU
MTFNDTLIGVLLALCGAILYLRTYKKAEKKLYAWLGILLLFIGVILIVGPSLFNAAYNSH